MLGIGITATDTEMGKTIVSGALAAAIRQRGYQTGVYKPAASGCVRNSEGRAAFNRRRIFAALRRDGAKPNTIKSCAMCWKPLGAC